MGNCLDPIHWVVDSCLPHHLYIRLDKLLFLITCLYVINYVWVIMGFQGNIIISVRILLLAGFIWKNFSSTRKDVFLFFWFSFKDQILGSVFLRFPHMKGEKFSFYFLLCEVQLLSQSSQNMTQVSGFCAEITFVLLFFCFHWRFNIEIAFGNNYAQTRGYWW